MNFNLQTSLLAYRFGVSCIKTALVIVLLLCSLLTSSQDVAEPPAAISGVGIHNVDKIIYGLASYYAQKFDGRRTANGETFSQGKLTAACNVLPLGTWIQVTNLKNGKIIVVRTNDRLHPKTRRLIDLSLTGATKLGFVKYGLTRVKIEILKQKNYKKLADKSAKL